MHTSLVHKKKKMPHLHTNEYMQTSGFLDASSDTPTSSHRAQDRGWGGGGRGGGGGDERQRTPSIQLYAGGGGGFHALGGAILSTPPAVATSPQIPLHIQPEAQVWAARAVERCCLLQENI